MFHGLLCPSIKAYEYYPDGTLKRIEFREMPPAAALPKPFDLEAAKRREAASPWKKDWDGPGTPTPLEELPTYEQWKAKKEQSGG